jgi:hypothetical protein
MTDPTDDGYELVMPFVACASNGGPYDDDAFVAGYHAGQIDRSLAAVAAVGGTELRVTTYAQLLPQLDLIAMQHGFQVASEAAEDAEGWAFVTFRREP